MNLYWSRWSELLIGGWLLASPFVLGHPSDHVGLWTTDLVCGGLVILFALASLLIPPGRAHYLSLGVVSWLVGFGYLAGTHPVSAGLQNDLLTGLLLVMFVVLPTRNIEPPADWVSFHASYDRSKERGN